LSLVIKEISGRKYAYAARREGSRVVHAYLGPVSDPAVAEKIRGFDAEKKVPEGLRVLFWDTDPSLIDLRRNKRYVIERCLEIGGMDAILWLYRLYPLKEIAGVLETSRKISPRSRNFWKIWLKRP